MNPQDTLDPREVRRRNVARCHAAGLRLPTFAELADPSLLPAPVRESLGDVDPDAPDARNLFRVHWHNAPDRRGLVDVPGYVRLDERFTRVPAPIFVATGNRFPLIGAHKVLAAYACIAPRLVTGRFDLERHRAIWPSTGNYCRGGVAISRLLGGRGVAVLPTGMSAERFEWLARWVADPADVVRTPGSESNVKEIYDECRVLERDSSNVILNQFSEYANHVVHHDVTGRALDAVYEDARRAAPDLRLAAFVSATGSAGTIGAGDYLKSRHGTRIVAAEALECPTMLKNGYGEHNIQGIGDKHVPLIHNVMNTDVVAAVTDRATDVLGVVFNNEAGRRVLARTCGLDDAEVAALGAFGLSSICNVLAAIRVAKELGLGKDDAVVTVATDGAELYCSESARVLDERFGGRLDEAAAARALDEHLFSDRSVEVLPLSPFDRERIFNLGYYTWVEQQGVSLADFEARRHQEFWAGLREERPAWDRAIAEFNAEIDAA